MAPDSPTGARPRAARPDGLRPTVSRRTGRVDARQRWCRPARARAGPGPRRRPPRRCHRSRGGSPHRGARRCARHRERRRGRGRRRRAPRTGPRGPGHRRVPARRGPRGRAPAGAARRAYGDRWRERRRPAHGQVGGRRPRQHVRSMVDAGPARAGGGGRGRDALPAVARRARPARGHHGRPHRPALRGRGPELRRRRPGHALGPRRDRRRGASRGAIAPRRTVVAGVRRSPSPPIPRGAARARRARPGLAGRAPTTS